MPGHVTCDTKDEFTNSPKSAVTSDRGELQNIFGKKKPFTANNPAYICNQTRPYLERTQSGLLTMVI
jgi:hypothetical protein